MTTFQKFVKYFGIALAILLIIGIFSGIIKLITGIAFVEEFIDNTESTEKQEAAKPDKNYTTKDTVEHLNIELEASALEIKIGDELKVDYKSDDFKVTTRNKTLNIEEIDRNIFNVNKTDNKVILHIPEDMSFTSADIETGAGVVKIEKLFADTLDFDLGAGDVEINYINIPKRAEIDGGAGKFTIKDCHLGLLDLEMGVGELNLKGILGDGSEIDFGVGKANIDLVGDVVDYKLSITKGLGNISLNKENIGNGTYGDGKARIKLNGGIGNIDITTTLIQE